MNYPKWKYSADSQGFRSTLVADARAEAELGEAWTDDPHAHGFEVVPYPAELREDGTIVHHAARPDANGNHAYGPAPTASGINGAEIAKRT
jgi:hypothetical protein